MYLCCTNGDSDSSTRSLRYSSSVPVCLSQSPLVFVSLHLSVVPQASLLLSIPFYLPTVFPLSLFCHALFTLTQTQHNNTHTHPLSVLLPCLCVPSLCRVQCAVCCALCKRRFHCFLFRAQCPTVLLCRCRAVALLVVCLLMTAPTPPPLTPPPLNPPRPPPHPSLHSLAADLFSRDVVRDKKIPNKCPKKLHNLQQKRTYRKQINTYQKHDLFAIQCPKNCCITSSLVHCPRPNVATPLCQHDVQKQ